MTTPPIDELKAMLAKATALPWLVKADAGLKVGGPIKANDKRDVVCLFPLLPRETETGTNEQNAALIVAAVNALPSLLAAAERGARIEAAARVVAKRMRRIIRDDDCDCLTHHVCAKEVATHEVQALELALSAEGSDEG